MGGRAGGLAGGRGGPKPKNRFSLKGPLLRKMSQWYACIRAANKRTFAGKVPKCRKNREQTAAQLSGLWWLGLQRLGLWRPYWAVPNPSSPQPIKISVPFSYLKMSRSQQLGTSTPFWRTRNTSRTMVRLPTSFPSKSAIPRPHRKI